MPPDLAMMHFEGMYLAIPNGKTLKVSSASVDQLFDGDIEAMRAHLRNRGVSSLEVAAKGDHLYITHASDTPKY